MSLLESAARACNLGRVEILGKLKKTIFFKATENSIFLNVQITGADGRTPEEFESNGKFSVPYKKEPSIYFLCNP